MLQSNKAMLVGGILALFCANAYGNDGILLNCDRWKGEQQFQIYINEAKGYVLYNAQFRDDNFEREREYRVEGGEEGETTLIDDGIDIVLSNTMFIKANDQSATFQLSKKNGTYGYAWTSLIGQDENGEWIADAFSHNGKCSTNPFVQVE